jgi:hypothetical protein
MRQLLLSALGMLAVTLTFGCASKPPPPPAQAEVPIRTPDEVARDQASNGDMLDPAACASKNPPASCPKKTNSDVFADTRTGRRMPRMLGK